MYSESAPVDPVKQAFETLGLHEGASSEEVDSAYRKMMRASHTDINPDLSHTLSAEINAAKDVIKMHMAQSSLAAIVNIPRFSESTFDVTDVEENQDNVVTVEMINGKEYTIIIPSIKPDDSHLRNNPRYNPVTRYLETEKQYASRIKREARLAEKFERKAEKQAKRA